MTFSNNTIILENELMPIVREHLATGNKVRYLKFKGVSMLPMLRQKTDSVELSPLPDVLKKYDLPLYQYPSGKYVMHRIIGIEGDNYLCRGDNTYVIEKIPREYMIGIVSSFKRGNRLCSVNSIGYKLYCRFWNFIFPVRNLLVHLKKLLRRVLK